MKWTRKWVREIITMRDWTRGTISTRSLKRTRSTFPPAEEASWEWFGWWVGEELLLLSSESHDFGSPKLLEFCCKSTKRWASYILFLFLFLSFLSTLLYWEFEGESLLSWKFWGSCNCRLTGKREFTSKDWRLQFWNFVKHALTLSFHIV